MQIDYRLMTQKEAIKINEIDASQFIGKAWRNISGTTQLVDINYHDPTWPNGFEHHYSHLVKTIDRGGIALGAFDLNNRLLGFVTVNPEIFGIKHTYVLLDQLFVTRDYRGIGLGKHLFRQAIELSMKFNVEKILICAGSAEETIAFYQRMGCMKATEINEKLLNEDSRDIQLEYTL
jgi:GNAT superfamily N-acetyltransferase